MHAEKDKSGQKWKAQLIYLSKHPSTTLMTYQIRSPIQRFFINGFKDSDSLSNVIRGLSDNEKLVFYCPMITLKAELSIFDDTIKYAEINNVSCKTFIQKHGRIKKFFTRKIESIEAVSVECSHLKC